MRRDASELARRLAREAEAVCRHYLSKGRRQGRYWTVGDVRNTPGRSMYVRLSGPESGPGAAGRWSDAATAEHGDLLDVIRESCGLMEFRDVAEEARRFLSLPRAEPLVAPRAPAPRGSAEVARDTSAAARRLWRLCHPIENTHAERYLRARGILARCRFAALRHHPALRYREGNTVLRLPALVAAVTGNDGAVTGVQRTWLDPQKPAKANVAAPRKALGRVFGHAVRFGAPGGSLLVGEGIETVLSLVAAAPEAVAAAALSAGSLGAFAPPPGVTRLLIARDNDEAGHRAAERLARRCARAGVARTVLAPKGGDFNDDLIAFGPDALAAALAPWLRGEGVRETERSYRVGESGKKTRREAVMRKANTEEADKIFAGMRQLRKTFDKLDSDLGVALIKTRKIYFQMEDLSAQHEDLWCEPRRWDQIRKYADQKRQLLEPGHGRMF